MEFETGDKIKVKKNGVEYQGVAMPNSGKYVVLKLDSGYNIGVNPGDAHIELIEKKEYSSSKEKSETKQVDSKLPKVSIISTGGTIASKIDYRTGAVSAQFSADDILESIPELQKMALFKGRVVYNVLSENMKPEYWPELAEAVIEEIENGADGIIIAHGTDTMMYTAAVLSFMVKTPVPIVLVGSQRSADRPSSDNVMNVICAAKVATSDIAEVCVVMHDSISDDRCGIYRGVRVRKMHTSRRDAFWPINSDPIGFVDYSTKDLEIISDYATRNSSKLGSETNIDPRCGLIKFVPGAKPDILSYYTRENYRGIVIEGTGLGHVSSDWVPEIEKATKAGIAVVITSQCLYGRVCDRVYDTGRDLIKAGAIEGKDMLPEVALVKLMWALGQSNDLDTVLELMETNIAGEFSLRSLH